MIQRYDVPLQGYSTLHANFLLGSLTFFQVSKSLVVSGPLWTGPLHNAAYVTQMLNLAEQWGWVANVNGAELEKLLKQMVDESDPKLSFGYIKLDEVLLQYLFISFCFLPYNIFANNK